ncbi:MAG: metallophosphoesterase, partial [Chloroflexota bacterium]|nr:metallophosphoesterase [Chloroflexota bacterium]
LIVHTGDVFHQSRPSWSAVRCFIQHMRKLEAVGVPIVVIAGNHDTPQLRTAGTVFSVLELALPGVRFVTGYEAATFDLDELGLNVVAIPHGRLVSGPIVESYLQPKRRNILLTHGLAPTLAESPRHELGEVTLDTDLLSTDYDAILLGHFHKHERVTSNAWYAGATDRIGWNDEDHNPCWSLVRIDGDGSVSVQDQRISCRQMITLGAYDGEGQTAREVAAGVLEQAKAFARPDAMVRIELLNVDRRERRSAEAIVRRDPANSYLCLQMYSRADTTALFNEDVRLDDSVRMKGIADLFTEFCTEQPYDDAFRGRFLTRGQAALESAIRQSDVAVADLE